MEPVSATENSGRNTEAQRGAFRLTKKPVLLKARLPRGRTRRTGPSLHSLDQFRLAIQMSDSKVVLPK